jgi:hypothetical protein
MKMKRASAGAVTLILLVIALGSHSLVTVNAASSVRKSGGKAVVHRAGGIPTNAPSVPTSKANYIGLPSGEPTLGVTKNGDIFFSAITTNTRVDVQRSQDKGATWETVSPKIGGQRNAQLLTLDPYVYVDERTNRVFTVDLTVACSFLSFSDDQGESWITNPLACGRPVNDHMTIFTGPPATSTPVVYPNLVYYCWNDVASSSCSKSLDGGVTFLPTGSPAFAGVSPDDESTGFCGGLHGHGQVGPDGTVYIPRGYCGQPWLAFSKDEGATWTRVQVANNGSADHEASVDVDAKGNIYYAYIGRDRLPYVVISKNGGTKWGSPLMIGPPGLTEANLPSLDVGDPGKVAVAYFGSENSPYQKCRPDDCTENLYARTSWNGYTTMSANLLDNSPIFYSGTVNDPKDPVKRGRCGPGRCGTTIFDFIDVFIGPDGVPYTAWVDACILVCAGPDGASDSGNEGVLGRLVEGPSLR